VPVTEGAVFDGRHVGRLSGGVLELAIVERELALVIFSPKIEVPTSSDGAGRTPTSDNPNRFFVVRKNYFLRRGDGRLLVAEPTLTFGVISPRPNPVVLGKNEEVPNTTTDGENRVGTRYGYVLWGERHRVRLVEP
jgi:hypothetical protein